MASNNDRVLITGAGGVIGRAVTNDLTAAGYSKVTAVTSSDADLTRLEQADRLFDDVRPELVIHLAARVYGIMGNQSNKAAAFLDNTRININVIDAAQRCGTRKVVAMGSVAVYADGIQAPMRETDIWNGPPHDSEAPYAHSKRAMYAQLEAYAQQYGLEYAYCISTNLYGPDDRFDEAWGHVVPSLVSKFHRAANHHDPLVLWGSGNATRDFLYSADAARGIRMIAEGASGPINLATGQTHTIREAANLLTGISGFDGEIQWDSTMPDGQRMREYDVTRITSLGWEPQYDLDRGLALTYRWYDENVAAVRR